MQIFLCRSVSRENHHHVGALLKLSPYCPATILLNQNPRTMAFGIVFLLVIAVDVILPNKIISKMDVLGQSAAGNI